MFTYQKALALQSQEKHPFYEGLCVELIMTCKVF